MTACVTLEHLDPDRLVEPPDKFMAISLHFFFEIILLISQKKALQYQYNITINRDK